MFGSIISFSGQMHFITSWMGSRLRQHSWYVGVCAINAHDSHLVFTHACLPAVAAARWLALAALRPELFAVHGHVQCVPMARCRDAPRRWGGVCLALWYSTRSPRRLETTWCW